VVPDRSATEKREGASSGKTSDRLNRPASGNRRRANRSATSTVAVETAAICASQRTLPRPPVPRQRLGPTTFETTAAATIGNTTVSHRMPRPNHGCADQRPVLSSSAPRVGPSFTVE